MSELRVAVKADLDDLWAKEEVLLRNAIKNVGLKPDTFSYTGNAARHSDLMGYLYLENDNRLRQYVSIDRHDPDPIISRPAEITLKRR